MFVRRATSLCHQAHFIGVATSFAVRQLHFVSANIMKLRYAQMKLSAEADKRSCVLADTNTKNKSKSKDLLYFLEATPRFELGNQSFADSCLTTWLCRHIHLDKKMERMTRLELATSTLARWRSTR